MEDAKTNRHQRGPPLAAAVIVLAGPAPVSAQPDVRGFVSVNGGLQAATGSFSQDVVFAESGGVYRDVLSGAAAHEQASFDTSYVFRTGMLFDASGGVHVGRYFGFGIGVSRFGATDGVGWAAGPPLFFDRDRSPSAVVPSRGPRRIHLQEGVMIRSPHLRRDRLRGRPRVHWCSSSSPTVRSPRVSPTRRQAFSSAMHAGSGYHERFTWRNVATTFTSTRSAGLVRTRRRGAAVRGNGRSTSGTAALMPGARLRF